LLQAVQSIVTLNTWLAPFIQIQEHRAVNPKTGSTMDVLSSDAPSSYGLLPSFVIADELASWRNEEFWTSLFSAAAKRGSTVITVITNAPWVDSWVWRVREAIRQDPAWYFKSLPGSQASWIDPCRLDEQARLLPSASYDRLWCNIPQSGDGQGIDPGLIDAAVDVNHGPMTAGAGECYICAVDLSLKSDFSAVVVIGKSSKGLRLAHSEVFRPKSQYFGLKREKQIDLAEVRDRIKQLHSAFNFFACYLDPYQAGSTSQELMRMGVPAELKPYTTAFRMAMATELVNGFLVQG